MRYNTGINTRKTYVNKWNTWKGTLKDTGEELSIKGYIYLRGMEIWFMKCIDAF